MPEGKMIWVGIAGHKGYQISNFGGVRSIDRTVYTKTGNPRKLKGRIIKQQKINGYMTVSLGANARNKSVHRLVAFAFVKNPKPDLFDEVNHKDLDKTNNCASNLEWTDYAGNRKHARDNGVRFGRP